MTVALKPFYETMYILRPDLGEELTQQAIEKFKTTLGDLGGEEIQVLNRGRRRLAYPIRKFSDGIYIQLNYYGGSNTVTAFERAMRLSEDVMRYLTIAQEPPEPIPGAEPLDIATPE
ncbi:30S ribosomal protein S6 [Gloeomargarita lithophora Alchichica-D10]|uniref:Small ribosomal subunit protein bS6 n=1 Tax=Gloeomargarita lithophora Alchichica-D10 TaxID=1188229 RepID=A0A1J0AEP9_9CYAN|nr:30S ribosomal protein S6 [Gloeomargarita lithophora]APB34371.1 30S ribosomal protein S6 [Gloeomargarita lithophora Alchichica-D10]